MFKIWWKKILLGSLKNRLLSNEFRNKLINKVNSEVDIPKLTEEQERKLFRALVDAIIEILI